jgi:hypothetical protein
MNYYQAIKEELEKRGVEPPRPLFVALLRSLHYHHKYHHDQPTPTLAQQIHRWVSMTLTTDNIPMAIRQAVHEGKTAEAEDLKNHLIDLEIIRDVLGRYLPIWTADGVDDKDRMKWVLRDTLKLTKPDPEDDILKLRKDEKEPPPEGRRF